MNIKNELSILTEMELQNIQNQKYQNITYHVFQTLGTEKKSDYNKYEEDIANLKYSVDILQGFSSFKSKLSRKIVRKKGRTNTKKKTRLVHYRSLNDRNYENSSTSLDKLIKKNYYIKQKESNTNLSKDSKKKLNNIITNKNINIKDNEDINKNKNKNEIFITNLLNLEESENNNNNTYINNGTNRYTEYMKNTNKYNFNNKSYSLKKYLPPIKNTSHIFNIKSSNIRNNTLNNLNQKCSFLNQMINDNNKSFDNKKKESFFHYVSTENNVGGSKNKKILKINEDVVLNMIKRNKKIVNTIRQIKNNLEEANIDFETKFKYANWKYGIADMNKYFIDIDAYKKSEEDLINKRKSFFDRLDDIIEDIKKRKKNKHIENIAKQFGIKLKDKVNDKNKELEEETDKIIFKSRDLKTSLRELYKRRKEEKQNREKIENILIKCKDKFNNIKTKLNEYQIKERKLKEI